MTKQQRGPFPPTTISRDDFIVDGSDAWFRLVIYRLVQSSGRLESCREAFGRELGLTGSQFVVLMSVAYEQADQGVTIAAIASNVGLAATHVTTEVGRLIRQGLLQKKPNQADRRSVLVSLTEAGEQAVEQVAPVVTRVNDILFEGISAQELHALHVTTEKLVRNSEYALTTLKLLARQDEFSAGKSGAPPAQSSNGEAPASPSLQPRKTTP